MTQNFIAHSAAQNYPDSQPPQSSTKSSPQDLPTYLASPEDFKDNCGFGLVAHIEGKPSHHLVKTAIHSLSCMTHRGGVAADGKTGQTVSLP